MRFEGRVVLITGGGRGIGRATALRLAREGAVIAVVDRDAEPAQAVASEVGGWRWLPTSSRTTPARGW